MRWIKRMGCNIIFVLCCILLVSCSFVISTSKATTMLFPMVHGLHEALPIQKKPSHGAAHDIYVYRSLGVSKPTPRSFPTRRRSPPHKPRTPYGAFPPHFYDKPIINPAPKSPIPSRPPSHFPITGAPPPPPPTTNSYAAILPHPRHH